MDVSVSVGAAAEPQPAKAEARKAARRANASDLDARLENVEKLAELKRITAEGGPDRAAETVTYVGRGETSPSLLVENITSHAGHRGLYNMSGCNLSRCCFMSGEQLVDHPLNAVQILQQRLGRKRPAKEIPADQAIC